MTPSGYLKIMVLIINSMISNLQKIQKLSAPLFKSYGVKQAAVFGSMATGAATATSDIDLLVQFQGRKSLLDLVALEEDLEKKFGRKVDLVTYNSLHPLLRERIIKEQRVIYGQRS